MFARMTTLQFQPGKAQEGFDVLQNSVVPTIKDQHGFKGLLLLRDTSTGAAAALTFWEAEGDIAASASGNYPVQLQKLTGLISGPPMRAIYNVEELSLPAEELNHQSA
jgi:heme-degrading monooxygenase HmoA